MKTLAKTLTLLLTTISAAATPQELFPASIDLHESEPFIPLQCGTIGDFNGDGLNDALVSPGGFSAIQIVPALGGGDFGAAVAVGPPPFVARHLAVDDLNGDGLQDFVFVGGVDFASPILLYLNEGDLSFREIAVGAIENSVRELHIADVDGNGFKDVLVSSRGTMTGQGIIGAGLFIFEFDGTQFGSTPRVATTQPVEAFSALDLTGDGRSDVVFPSVSDRRWRLSASLANGGFSTPRTFFPPELDSALDIEFGDLDGDGDLDVAAIGFAAALDGFIVETDASGAFIPRGPFSTGGTFPRSLEIRDIDGDGVGDLLLNSLDNLQPQKFLYLRRGLGGFAYGPLMPVHSSSTIALGDLTGNGELNGLTGVAPNVSTVGFTERVGQPAGNYFNNTRRIFPPFGPPVRFAAIDVDGDGDEDFLAGGGTASQGFFWMQNVGGLAFERPASLNIPGGPRRVLDTLDLNGDGRRDLLVTGVVVSGLSVQFNRGPFDFDPPLTLSSDGNGAIFDVLPADFDGDGNQDFISLLSGSPGIRVFGHRNNGAGTSFTRTQLVPVQRDVDTAVFFDANGDSFTDFATFSAQAVSVSLSDGAGGFLPPVDIQTTGVPAPFSGFLDVDRDGDLDLLGRSLTGSWMWAENDSLGAFGMFQPLAIAGIDSATGIRPQDVNGDGLDDLVAFRAETTSNVDVFLLAEGTSSFAAPQRMGSSFFPTTRTRFVDLDGDGDLDAWSSSSVQAVVHGSESIPSAGSDAAVCSSALPNSTGNFGALRAFGSTSVMSDNLSLRAIRLPANQFGIFVGSTNIQAPVPVMGSAGALCLTGAIGRYDEPSELQSSGPGGTFAIPLDPAMLQIANGPVAAMAGQTWYFQAWHRDLSMGGAPTSNFTSAIELTFAP